MVGKLRKLCSEQWWACFESFVPSSGGQASKALFPAVVGGHASEDFVPSSGGHALKKKYTVTKFLTKYAVTKVSNKVHCH